MNFLYTPINLICMKKPVLIHLLWLLPVCALAQQPGTRPPIAQQQPALVIGSGQTLSLDFEKGYPMDGLHARSGKGAIRVKAGVHSLNPMRFFYSKGKPVSFAAYGHFATQRTAPLSIRQRAGIAAFTTRLQLTSPVWSAEMSPALSSPSPLPALAALAAAAVKNHRNRQVPDAFMNINYFNRKRELVHTQILPLTRQARNQWQPLVSTYHPTENGYAEVSFANASARIAYFDDLSGGGIDSVVVTNGYQVYQRTTDLRSDLDSVLVTYRLPCGTEGQAPCNLTEVIVIPTNGGSDNGNNGGGHNGGGTGGGNTGGGGFVGGGGSGSGGGSTGGSGGDTKPVDEQPPAHDSSFPPDPRPGDTHVINNQNGSRFTYQYRCINGNDCQWIVIAVVLPEATVRANISQYSFLPVNPINFQSVVGPDGMRYLYTFGTWHGNLLNLPDNPVHGQQHTITQANGQQVVYQFRCNNGVCVWHIQMVILPEAVVRADRSAYSSFPVNGVNGQLVYSLTTDLQRIAFVFNATSKQWQGKVIDPYKNPQRVDDPCAGYKEMLRIQTKEGKEVIGWRTSDGKVFIVPLSDRNANGQVIGTNTVDRSITSNQVYDEQGRMLIAVSRAQAGDLPGRLPGMWYLDYYSYDATGRATITTHLVSGHVHTHPTNGNENRPSRDYDIPFASSPNWQGIPKYILNENNLVEYDQNGVKHTQSYRNNCP